MRFFISLLLVMFCTAGLLLHDAEAKRFGGGKSFGVQRSSVSSMARPAAPIPGVAKSSASRWLGPLAGLAAGGLLASLFMGHGLGTGIMSWLLIAGLVFLAINLFRNRRPMAAKPGFYENPQRETRTFTPEYNSYTQSGDMAANYPAGFDSAAFLRDAKVQFIRLQAAYDQKNLSDLRSFTSPEVYAEIQLQFQERGNAENVTEVKTLEAQLINAVNEAGGVAASVRFSGIIREDHQEAGPFDEVWHFHKGASASHWTVAGIQQA